jgi:hypothetical protein
MLAPAALLPLLQEPRTAVCCCCFVHHSTLPLHTLLPFSGVFFCCCFSTCVNDCGWPAAAVQMMGHVSVSAVSKQ